MEVSLRKSEYETKKRQKIGRGQEAGDHSGVEYQA